MHTKICVRLLVIFVKFVLAFVSLGGIQKVRNFLCHEKKIYYFCGQLLLILWKHNENKTYYRNGYDGNYGYGAAKTDAKQH